MSDLVVVCTHTSAVRRWSQARSMCRTVAALGTRWFGALMTVEISWYKRRALHQVGLQAWEWSAGAP